MTDLSDLGFEVEQPPPQETQPTQATPRRAPAPSDNSDLGFEVEAGPRPTPAKPPEGPLYTLNDDGTLHVSTEWPAAGLRQAAKEGKIDQKTADSLLPQYQQLEDRYKKLIEDAGGQDVAKALIRGAGRGGAFMAGASAAAPVGTFAGSLTGPAAPVLAPVGGVVAGLAGGMAAAHGYDKALKSLAEYSDTVKEFEAAGQLHPVLNQVGELAAFGAGAPKAISNLRKLYGVAKGAGESGVGAVASQLGKGALGGAAFEGVVRPAVDAGINYIKNVFGMPTEPVQSPTLQSLATQVGLGMLLAGKGVGFQDFSQDEVGNIMLRGKAREAAGLPMGLDDPAAVIKGFADLGARPEADLQQSGLLRPLTAQEIQVYAAVKDRVDAMVKQGQRVGGFSARQAFVPSIVPGRRVPLTSATVEAADLGFEPETTQPKPQLPGEPANAATTVVVPPSVPPERGGTSSVEKTGPSAGAGNSVSGPAGQPPPGVVVPPAPVPPAAPAQPPVAPAAPVAPPAPTVPEPPETIAAQLQMLKEGKRNVVMITQGEVVPPLPKGMAAVQWKGSPENSGVFVFNPEKISKKEVLQAIADDRLGDILGYGIPRKPAKGTEIGAVVVRDRNGVEKHGVLTDAANLDRVIEAGKKMMSEGDTIGLEPEADVIRRRKEALAKPEPPLPIIQKIMGVDSIHVRAETIEGVHYDLFKPAPGQTKAAVLVTDADSGRKVSLKQYPSFEVAQKEYEETLKKAAPAPVQHPAEKAALIYLELWKAAPKGTGRWYDSLREDVQHPHQLEELKEDANPKGLKIGDWVIATFKSNVEVNKPTLGRVILIKGDAPPAYEGGFMVKVLPWQVGSYATWHGIDYVEPAKPATAVAAADVPPAPAPKPPRDSSLKPKKPKAPAAPPAPPAKKWEQVGFNSDGLPIYEDENGVRSYVENGVRVTEPVGIVPHPDGGTGISVKELKDKDPRFLTPLELPKDKPPEPVPATAPAAKPKTEVKSPLDNLSPEKKARAEELKKKIAQMLGGRTNIPGPDPELFKVAAELATLYAEGGVKTFEQFTKSVKEEMPGLWDRIKAYLRGVWNAVAEHLGLKEVSKEEAEAVLSKIEKPESAVTGEGDGYGAREDAEPWNEVSTGRSATVLAWRTPRGSSPKADSQFWAEKEEDALRYSPRPEDSAIRVGSISAFSSFEAPLKLNNPFVVYDKADAEKQLGIETSAVWEATAKAQEENLDPHYYRDPLIAEAARNEGYDAVIYEDDPGASGMVLQLLYPITEMRTQTGEPAPKDTRSPSAKVAQFVNDRLASGKGFTSKELFEQGDSAWPKSQAEGGYTPKDAYDAMEMGVNQFIQSQPERFNVNGDAAWASAVVSDLKHLISLLPTQSARTIESDKMQQFSTPPPFAYVVNWVGRVHKGDAVIEPSAGPGGIAVFAHNAGAVVIANELSERRLAILKESGLADKVLNVNAEHLHALLEPMIASGEIQRPTLVLMNPPFSNAAVSGETKNTMIGAQHIEQALKLLPEGGRLVAIVGEGMAMDKAHFKAWWKRIMQSYNVRANIGVSGDEYRKYGTGFGNQILVIDKTGTTIGQPITGAVEKLEELVPLLESVRNERRAIESAPAKPGSAPPAPAGAPGTGTTLGAPAAPGTGGAGAGRPRPGGSGAGGVRKKPRNPKAGDTDAGAGSEPGGSGDVAPAGAPGQDVSDAQTAAGEGMTVEQLQEGRRELNEHGVFAEYHPSKVKIPGAQKHPTPLVEPTAMAAVESPDVNYTPNIPKALVTSGDLSEAQLEALVYAGMAHAKFLPTGERLGFFIGDGTGVGKGREIAGVDLDNWLSGRKKHVWVSKTGNLSNDAKRDLGALGFDTSKLHVLSKLGSAGLKEKTDGIAYVTYSGLSKNNPGLKQTPQLQPGEKRPTPELEKYTGKGKEPWIKVLADWLGDPETFDGVIAFDEAHLAGNAIDVKGTRGMKKASERGKTVVQLQQMFPKARILYVSATGATDVTNLSYADRLGIWGHGTPFPNKAAFFNTIKAGGLSAMEIVARDLKSMGRYIARTLSFEGVEQVQLEHKLTGDQKAIYGEAAKAWQLVFSEVDNSMAQTGQGNNGFARGQSMSKLYGAQQRFFNTLLTAMQMPTVLADAKQRIEEGHAILMQVVNTGDASLKRELAKKGTEEDMDLETLDLSPKDIILQYVDNCFPTTLFQPVADDEGNITWRPVLDDKNNPVDDPAALAAKQALLDRLATLAMPQNPLDMVMDTFGVENVAEVTGRSQRVVQVKQPDGTRKRVLQSRSEVHNKADSEEYQDDKRKVLVFSDAGGTGFSYHASRKVKNQRRRFHYLIQAGWKADTALQGMGRSHRADQAESPYYKLAHTDLKGHQRFISTIARRLSEMGALIGGERESTKRGLFDETNNLENKYAEDAVMRLFFDLFNSKVEAFDFNDITAKLGYVRSVRDSQTGEISTESTLKSEDGQLIVDKIPSIQQFLNRILALEYSEQNALFDEFMQRMMRRIENAKADGSYDPGTQTLKALSIRKLSDEVVYEHPESTAKTRLVEVESDQPTITNKWEDINTIAPSENVAGYVQNKQSKKIYALKLGPVRTLESGSVVQTWRRISPTSVDIRPQSEVKTEQTWEAGGWKDPNYEAITDANVAREEWRRQFDSAPKTYVERDTYVVGAFLPIWDRLQLSNPKIWRITTDDKETFLGAHVPPDAVAALRSRMGAGKGAKLTPEQAFDQITKDNVRIKLSNGWALKRTLRSGENRIEVIGVEMNASGEFTTYIGGYIERIDFKPRFFLPNDRQAGVEALDKVLKKAPPIDESDAQASLRLPTEPPEPLPPEPKPEPPRGTFHAYNLDQLRDALPHIGLTPDAERLLSEFLKLPVAKLLQGLQVKVADVLDGGWQGSYFNKLAELARNATPETGPEELLHAVWELLPPDMQAEFERMRVASLKQLATEARAKGMDERVFEDLIENPSAGGEDFLSRGYPVAVRAEAYSFSNASEYFAKSGSRRFSQKVGSMQKGFWERVKDFIRNIIGALKRAIRLKPTQAELLERVMRGDFEPQREPRSGEVQGAWRRKGLSRKLDQEFKQRWGDAALDRALKDSASEALNDPALRDLLMDSRNYANQSRFASKEFLSDFSLLYFVREMLFDNPDVVASTGVVRKEREMPQNQAVITYLRENYPDVIDSLEWMHTPQEERPTLFAKSKLMELENDAHVVDEWLRDWSGDGYHEVLSLDPALANWIDTRLFNSQSQIRAEDAAAVDAAQASLPLDANLDPEEATGRIATKVFGEPYYVHDREQINPQTIEASAQTAKAVLDASGITATERKSVDDHGRDVRVWVFEPQGRDMSAEGRRLLTNLKRELSARPPGKAGQELANLLNSIVTNYAMGGASAMGQMDSGIRNELWAAAQSDRSARGIALQALYGVPEDLKFIGRNVDVELGELWNGAFNGDELRRVLDELADARRQYDEAVRRGDDLEAANALLQKALDEALKKKGRKGLRKLMRKGGLSAKILELLKKGQGQPWDVLKVMAEANGWRVPTDDDLMRMKRWVDEWEALEKLSPAEDARHATKEAKAAALRQKLAVTENRRIDLRKQVETMWHRLTHPWTLRNATGRANVVNALGEWVSANLLLKVGFASRQTVDVLTQGAMHTPTRAVAAAIELHKTEVEHGRRSKHDFTPLIADAGDAIKKAYYQRAAALKATLTTVAEVMRGKEQGRHVARLMGRISIFDRMMQRADELARQGKTGEAFAMRTLTWLRLGYRVAQAMDNLHGQPAIYQEMRQQVVGGLRKGGMSRAEADSKADWVMSTTRAEVALAQAEAAETLALNGVTGDERQLRAATYRLLQAKMYEKMRALKLPADDYEGRNLELLDTIGWNEKEDRGPGGVVGNTLRKAGQMAAKTWAEHPIIGAPALAVIPLTRFANAIAILINRKATWTGLGFMPGAFGAAEAEIDDDGIAKNASPWYRTATDRTQRKVEAATGVGTQIILGLLAGVGAIIVRQSWPKSKEERDEWDRKGWKPGQVAIPTGGGKHLTLSMNTGFLVVMSPGLSAGGALRNKLDDRAKAQLRLNEQAEKLGLAPGKIKDMDVGDWMGIAGQAAWGAIISGRTLSGLVGSVSDFGQIHPVKGVASEISAFTPTLPGFQELDRMAFGTVLNSQMATVWDFLMPTPASGAAQVNVLGDKVGDANGLQRVVGILTGGNYPFPVNDKVGEGAYRTLFESGYRPPAIDASRGYAIGNEFRPFNDKELARYAQLRGSNLKESLAGADANDPASLKAAYQEANQQALETMGVDTGAAKAARTAGSGGSGRSAGPGPALATMGGAAGSAPASRGRSLGGGRTGSRGGLGRVRRSSRVGKSKGLSYRTTFSRMRKPRVGTLH